MIGNAISPAFPRKPAGVMSVETTDRKVSLSPKVIRLTSPPRVF